MGKSSTVNVVATKPLLAATKLYLTIDKTSLVVGETTTIRTWIAFWDTSVWPPDWRLVPGGRTMVITITRPDGGVEAYSGVTSTYGTLIMDYTFTMDGTYSVYTEFAGDATYAGCPETETKPRFLHRLARH